MRTIKKQTYAARKQGEPEIEGLLHALSALYDQYRKKVLLAVTVVLAVAAAAGVYALYQAGRDGKASAMLSRASAAYGSGQADYGKALDMFREVRKSYPGTLSAAIARYYAGNSLMSMGQPQQAITEYQDLIKRHGREKELTGLAYQRMGYAYEMLGNREESLRSFERAEALLGAGIATVELAKRYEQAGKTEESQKRYKMIADKLPGTGLSAEAKRKISASTTPPSAPGALEK